MSTTRYSDHDGEMDHGRFSIQRMTLQAFDLSERTARASRRSARQRLERLRNRSVMILQAAVTTGLAWLLATRLLGHPSPFFAPVAAIITLGFTFGQRLRRGFEVAIGVAVGVGTGDLFVRFLGTGPWQVTVVCLIAMTIAVLVGAGTLMTTQAGVQAIIATTLLPNPHAGIDRWLDALVGAGLALLVAAVLPVGPLRKPRVLAANFLSEVAGTVRAAAAALRAEDAEAGDAVLQRARNGESMLTRLREVANEGVAVVRHSPLLRRRLPTVRAIAELYPPLDRLSRNLRVLARRCAVALWRDETVPLSYLGLLDELAEAVEFAAARLSERQLPTAAQEQLIQVGENSSRLTLHESMSAVVILAQARSMLVDLLELAGLDPSEARSKIPEVLD